MKIKGYLVINNKGSCRFVKNKVGVGWNEVLMGLSIEIPDSVFKRPVLEANIKIDGELNHKFNYELREDIQDVLETMPNVHLLNINVQKELENEED